MDATENLMNNTADLLAKDETGEYILMDIVAMAPAFLAEHNGNFVFTPAGTETVYGSRVDAEIAGLRYGPIGTWKVAQKS